MAATKVKKQTVDDMKRKGKKKMSDDDQTQTDVEPDPSIGIWAILESIQGSLTALAFTSLRSTLKKAPQQLSPLLVVLDQLSPPPFLPPPSVVPVKKDFRDELGVVTPIGFFDPIGKVSQIHTTPSSNHIVIAPFHHNDMALSINQSSTTHYLLPTYIGFTSTVDIDDDDDDDDDGYDDVGYDDVGYDDVGYDDGDDDDSDFDYDDDDDDDGYDDVGDNDYDDDGDDDDDSSSSSIVINLADHSSVGL